MSTRSESCDVTSLKIDSVTAVRTKARRSMTWEELFKAVKAIFILGLVMVLSFYGMFRLLSPHSPTPPTPTQPVLSPAFTQAILDALIHA